jgi:hypothetical protein
MMWSKPRGIAPYFLVEDVKLTAEYYRDRLGFEIGPYFLDPPVFVILQRQGAAIQLSRHQGNRGGSNRRWKVEAYDAYVWVDNVDALYHEFAEKHAEVIESPRLKEHGMKEMDVRDPDGYVIRWGQDIPDRG